MWLNAASYVGLPVDLSKRTNRRIVTVPSVALPVNSRNWSTLLPGVFSDSCSMRETVENHRSSFPWMIVGHPVRVWIWVLHEAA